jgi:hypothetical protein
MKDYIPYLSPHVYRKLLEETLAKWELEMKKDKEEFCLECGKEDVPYCLLCSECFTKRQGSS